MDYEQQDGKTSRLISLCQQTGANQYLSGPIAKDYLDIELFHQHGIEVEFMDYSHYPVYQQFHPPFEHGVSIIDLIFHQGKNHSIIFSPTK